MSDYKVNNYSNYFFLFTIIIIISVIFVEILFTMIDFIIPMFYGIICVLSCTLYYHYKIQLDVTLNIKDIMNSLCQDLEWDEINNKFEKLPSHLNKIAMIESKKLLLIAIMILTIFSLIYNIFLFNVMNYLFPIVILIFIIINENLLKKNKIRLSELIDYIFNTQKDILDYIINLNQHQDPFLDDHFDYIKKKIVILNKENRKFINIIENYKKKALSINEYLFIFKEFQDKIRLAFEIQGNLSTLMENILRVKHFQFQNIKKQEQLIRLEQDQKILEQIEEKEENFNKLNLLIEQKKLKFEQEVNEKSILLKENLNKEIDVFRENMVITLKEFKNTMNENLMNFSQEIDKKISNLDESWNKKLMIINEKNQDSYKKNFQLYSDMMKKFDEFYLSKLNLESIKNISVEKFYKLKKFGDFYISQMKTNLSNKEQLDLMTKLCQIYDDLTVSN